MDKPSIDVSFLTDKERAVLLKVIKADLELKKTTLGYLKKAVEVGRQFQLSQKSTEDARGKCACCGQVFRTFCDRKNAIKCQQCQYLICKLCKREQGGSVSCILCVKEKLYALQSMDYLPVFHQNGTNTFDMTEEVDGGPTQLLYGSDLLKKCLESARRQLTETLTVPAEKKSDHTKSFTLPLMQKGERSRKAPAIDIPSIDDSKCGFKVIQQATNDEKMIDLCSLYSEPCDPEDYDVQGEIKLGVWYRVDEQTLYVRVAKAKNLSAANDDGTSDPYVKTYLLPDKGKLAKRRTTIQRTTTKPTFNELLKYGKINREEVKGKTLLVSMSDWDRFGRNQFLGEVRLPLSSLDLTDSTDKWYTLENMEQRDEFKSSGSKGKLLLSLMFEPYDTDSMERSKPKKRKSLGKLKVLIKQAEDLKPNDTSAQINPFARCYLLPTRLVDSKKKSRVVRDSSNPIWDSEIEYTHVKLEDLESNRVLEVTVWDQDRRGVNEFIGGIRVGPDPLTSSCVEWMDSIGGELSHWEAALARPGEWVEQWHNLRPSMNSLNQRVKRRQRQPARMYNQELAASNASISSASSVTSSGSYSRKSKSLPPHSSKSSLRKSSMESIKSLSMRRTSRGNYSIRGEILVTVEYKDEHLHVFIDRGVKIAAVNRNGTSDSYVKTYLLPDQTKHSKRKTEVQKKTVDPVYNTTLKYKVPSVDQLVSRAIWLTVWHTSKLTSNTFLGEICIPLSTVDFYNPSEQWYALHDFTESGVILPSGVLQEEDEDEDSDDDMSRSSPSITMSSIRSSSVARSSQSKSASPMATHQSTPVPEISVEDDAISSEQDSPEPDLTMNNITQRNDNISEDSIIPVATTSEVIVEVYVDGD